jgi:hypothetical protein
MPTLCLPVVYSLPARGVLVTTLRSMRCGLTTPPFMQVLPIKRRSSCDIRARYCDALCAAMMTQFLYRLSCSFRLSVAAVARNCARASCTIWCGDTRGLCVQKWFGLGDECTRLSFERSGAALWTDPPASVWTSVANCCYLRAGCCRAVRAERSRPTGKVALV